jgi:hypothetical protein
VRKLLTSLLVACMLFSVVTVSGCGKKEDKDKDKKEDSKKADSK